MIFMNLEQRSIYCEEIGQQFLSYGKHKPPEEWAREIDALTKEDIMVAVQGDVKLSYLFLCVWKGCYKGNQYTSSCRWYQCLSEDAL